MSPEFSRQRVNLPCGQAWLRYNELGAVTINRPDLSDFDES